MWAGANDYLALGLTDTDAIATSVRNNAVRIADTGLDSVLVLDQPLWGFTPIGFNRADSASLNLIMQQHNVILKSRIAEAAGWGFGVHYVPVSQLFIDVYLNPRDYGFSVVRPGTGTTGHCVGDGLILDACPSTYAFYDEIHPSGALHSQIAQFVNAQWAAIDASARYSGFGTGSASPVLAYQSAALSSGGSLNATPGFAKTEIGTTTAFVFDDQSNAPGDAFETAFDQIDNDARFQMIGVTQELTTRSRVTLAYTSGSLQGVDQTARRATNSRGWAMSAERDAGPWTLSVSAMEPTKPSPQSGNGV